MLLFPASSEPARAGHGRPGPPHSVAASSRSLGRERAATAPRSRETQRSDRATAARPVFFEPPTAQGERGAPSRPSVRAPPRRTGPALPYRPRPILVFPCPVLLRHPSASRPAPSSPVPFLPRCAPPRLAPSLPFLHVPVCPCLFLPSSAWFCPVLLRLTVFFLYRPPAHPSYALLSPVLSSRVLLCPFPSRPALSCPILLCSVPPCPSGPVQPHSAVCFFAPGFVP